MGIDHQRWLDTEWLNGLWRAATGRSRALLVLECTGTSNCRMAFGEHASDCLSRYRTDIEYVGAVRVSDEILIKRRELVRSVQTDFLRRYGRISDASAG